MADALLTVRELAAMREAAEAAILAVLTDLTDRTGLDLARVDVMLVVDADDADNPRRWATAVRIDLCV